MSETQTEELTLREMLAKAGITQKKIAEKAKVSPAAVSLIVAGKWRRPFLVFFGLGVGGALADRSGASEHRCRVGLTASWIS